MNTKPTVTTAKLGLLVGIIIIINLTIPYSIHINMMCCESSENKRFAEDDY